MATRQAQMMAEVKIPQCVLIDDMIAVVPGGLLADAYETGTQIQILNTVLAAAKVYMAVWRA